MIARLLAGAALLLGAVAAWGFLTTGFETEWRGMLACFALLGLSELPAWWWRWRGGRAGATLLVAFLGPLLLMETWLGTGASQDVGGDLQGIDQLFMIWVAPPVALVSALVTAFLAVMLIRPDREEE
jgi:hypothetical protein